MKLYCRTIREGMYVNKHMKSKKITKAILKLSLQISIPYFFKEKKLYINHISIVVL